MFDMNKLWEEYVYVTLRKLLPGYTIKAQARKKLWHSDGCTKIIKPDILIEKKDKVVFVLDTKWKCPDRVPSDGDLHQMFVYQQLFNAKKVALVYPSADNTYKQACGFFESGSSCDMLYFPIKMDFSLESYLE